MEFYQYEIVPHNTIITIVQIIVVLCVRGFLIPSQSIRRDRVQFPVDYINEDLTFEIVGTNFLVSISRPTAGLMQFMLAFHKKGENLSVTELSFDVCLVENFILLKPFEFFTISNSARSDGCK